MKLNLTKKAQLQTNTWAGGTTTQLAIYPKDAIYKNLDFVFRISTATIDVEESTFTSLPNVNRVIMVLSGELTIQHKNQYNKKLEKFDTDNFSGKWETTSIGKVTDFNVMTRGAAKAAVQGFSLDEDLQKEIPFNCDVMTIYVSSGEISIENLNLFQGDILLIEKENNFEKVILLAKQLSEVAITYINF
jgi:environmental stress-induced protein Ves